MVNKKQHFCNTSGTWSVHVNQLWGYAVLTVPNGIFLYLIIFLCNIRMYFNRLSVTLILVMECWSCFSWGESWQRSCDLPWTLHQLPASSLLHPLVMLWCSSGLGSPEPPGSRIWDAASSFPPAACSIQEPSVDVKQLHCFFPAESSRLMQAFKKKQNKKNIQAVFAVLWQSPQCEAVWAAALITALRCVHVSSFCPL